MNVEYRVIKDENIDFLKDLCNGLMKFQADHATIRPEIMGSMNYENRLKPEYASAERKFIITAYDGERPIGFAFATVTTVTEDMMKMKPSWAEETGGFGFYPDGYETPRTVGTFKILFLEETYRKGGVGKVLTEKTMEWLESQPDVKDLWVYVANGNEVVGKLYEKYGFCVSHEVFNGFIHAYMKNIR